MSKTSINRDEAVGISRFDRREFMAAGMALALTAMLPQGVFAAPAKRPQAIPPGSTG